MTDMILSFKTLEGNGIPVAPYHFVTTTKEALEKANKLGFPVVLKLSSQIHKTEVGGVITHIKNELDLVNAWREIRDNLTKNNIQFYGLILQKQLDGVELILGLKKDKIFGPVVMLGGGGTFAEVMKDVSFRACPISEKDAEQMISEIKASKLLKGFRGKPAADLKKLKQTMIDFSKLAQKIKFEEVDINPLICNDKGSWAADARIL